MCYDRRIFTFKKVKIIQLSDNVHEYFINMQTLKKKKIKIHEYLDSQDPQWRFLLNLKTSKLVT